MEKDKESFIFYVEWRDVLMDYPAEVRLEVYDAIIEYAASGRLSELKPLAKMAFSFIKKDMDRNTDRYRGKVDTNRENGKKGGAPMGNSNARRTENNPKQPKTTENNRTSEKTTETTLNDNDNDNDYYYRSSDELLSGSSPHPAETIDYNALADFFNRETKGVFGVIRPPLSDKRKGMVNARIKEHGKQAFMDMIHKACKSDFLRGQNGRNWTASFDWLIKPTNFEKVLSGNYDNRSKETGGTSSAGGEEDFMRNIAEGIARANYEKQRRANGGEPVS